MTRAALVLAALACGGLYVTSLLIGTRVIRSLPSDDAEVYFVAGTGVFLLLMGGLIVAPSIALWVQRRRALRGRTTRPMAGIAPEIVLVPLKPVESNIGFYDLKPAPPFSMPPVCSCCCSDQELSTVTEDMAYRRFKIDAEGQRQFYHKHTRYLGFDVPYCKDCLLHVRLGGRAPMLAVLAAALMFPAIDQVCHALTGRRPAASGVWLPTLYCVGSTALLLVGLLYVWFWRQTSRVPARYHWAAVVIGAVFFGLLYWPAGLTILVAFGLGRGCSGALGLSRAAEECAYWNWGKALTCLPTSPVGPTVELECGNRRYAQMLAEQNR